MTTTINASTSAGLVQTADTSGVLALQTAGTTAVTIDASQNVTIAKPVALSGSTSGAITLSAPAVSGTNTATLPAATGTVMVSGNMPAFGAYMSTNQSLSSGNTKIAFDTKVFDTNSNFNTANYRFTPTVAGYYQFNVFVYSTGTMTGAAAQVWKNGNTGTFANIQGTQVQGNISYGVSASGIIYMNGSTDYAECYLYVAASTTVQGGNGGSTFSASLIRGA